MYHHIDNRFFLKVSLIVLIIFIVLIGSGRQVFEHYSGHIQDMIQTNIEKYINKWIGQ